jgi:hypothetical protein
VRTLRAGLAAALLGAAMAAVAQEPAMRLEALSERIAKLHAQLGQGVLVERSRRALPEAVREFDAALREVKARASGPEVRDTYVMLGLLWTEYRAWALKPATRDNAKKLAERAEEVAWVAAKGARLVHGSGRKGTGLLALDAAHAATLSQRLARLYLLRRWDVKPGSAERAAPAVEADLQRTLEKLRSAPYNTPEIDTELQAAQGQLGFLLQAGRALDARRPDMRTLEFAAKSADHLLESMQRVVRLYEGVAPATASWVPGWPRP